MSIFFIIITAFILWIPQTILHELSHVISAKKFGAKDIKISLFPKWGKESLIPKYFSFITYNASKEISNGDRALIACSPQIINSIIMTTILFSNLIIPMKSVFGCILFSFYLTNFIDGSFNLLSIFKNSGNNDIWKFTKSLGIGIKPARVIVILWIVLFIRYPVFFFFA